MFLGGRANVVGSVNGEVHGLCLAVTNHPPTRCQLTPPLPPTGPPTPRYVLCPGCKSVDTLLDRDATTRLMYLRCQQCGASRSVATIKSGFVARVTKRTH